VLQFVAVRHVTRVMSHIWVTHCNSVLQCVAVRHVTRVMSRIWHTATVCCSVLQCVMSRESCPTYEWHTATVCCSVLQCVMSRESCLTYELHMRKSCQLYETWVILMRHDSFIWDMMYLSHITSCATWLFIWHNCRIHRVHEQLCWQLDKWQDFIMCHSCVRHDSRDMTHSYIRMSHVTRMNESWHTYEWITSQIQLNHIATS